VRSPGGRLLTLSNNISGPLLPASRLFARCLPERFSRVEKSGMSGATCSRRSSGSASGDEPPAFGYLSGMITDRPPRPRRRREEFRRSDETTSLALPDDDRLKRAAGHIETALKAADREQAQTACRSFALEVAAFYGIEPPGVRVLAARPLRARKYGREELFGDYDLDSGLIRVFMRTAVHKRVTSYGTLLSTLCHELCHHLDLHYLGFAETPHTRGFYERTAALYHAGRNTPRKPLHWIERADGTWQVDWARLRQRRPARPGAG
jgi:hypothetical protein